MPVNYSTPAWLVPRGQTDAESYAKGFALGEARRAEQARIAAQMAQAQMESAARAQAQAQRTAMAQAELASEIKKQEEAASIAREELAIKKQAQAQKDAFAARKTAGILAVGQKVGSGRPLLEAIGEHPEAWMGESTDLAGLASLKRALEPAPPFTPSIMTIPGQGGMPDRDVIQERPNSWRTLSATTAKTTQSPLERSKMGRINDRIKKAEESLLEQQGNAALMPAGSTSLAAAQKEIVRLQKVVSDGESELENMGQPSAPAQPAPAAAATGPVRLRRKSDGKTFTYRGKREDVPGAYEILE